MIRPDDSGFDNNYKEYRPDQLPEIQPDETRQNGQPPMQSVGDILQDQQQPVIPVTPPPEGKGVRRRPLKRLLWISFLLGLIAGLIAIAALFYFDKI